MNWRACNFAAQYGFACADSFAQYMGADYDSNGDGQIDSDALRYVQGESESAYVTRITTTLRSTIRDANTHFVERRARATTTSSPTTRTRPTPARRSASASSAARAPARARPTTAAPDRRRQEPGLEPARPRAHGLGALGLQPGDAVTRVSAKEPRSASSSGTPP